MSVSAPRLRWSPVAGLLLPAAFLILVAPLAPSLVGRSAQLIAALAVIAATVYVIWHVPPAWSVSAALVLSVFGSNWDYLHFPSFAAPDRFVLGVVILAVIFRAPAVASRPRPRFSNLYVLAIVSALYGLGSALVAGTLFERGPLFNLVDRMALLSIVVFVLGPTIFATPRDRNVLLGAMVALGGYLGLTALFETIGATALVWPRYISDPSIGIHFGRARGPFAQAALNGLAIYACLVASFIALHSWRGRRSRLFAYAVIIVCAPALLFTLQRSIWIGASVATLVVLTSVARLRRFVIPTVLTGMVIVVGAFALIPGLEARAQARRDTVDSIQGRQALNDAAVNMILDRPLFGFGWSRYPDYSDDYYETSDEYATWVVERGLIIHNAYLSNAVELGLIGTALWLAVMAFGVGGAILRSGPAELVPWRIGLAAIFGLWLFVAVAAPLRGAFQSLLLWTWAAVIVGGTRAPDDVRPS